MRVSTTVKLMLLLLVHALSFPETACAQLDGTVRVAAASNFAATARTLAAQFRSETGTEVEIVAGSTGKHYAQILQGAPFDLFLAADSLRPFLLEESGHAFPGSRRTYALGRLVLWLHGSNASVESSADLARLAGKRVALANPVTAPYGSAARTVLQSVGLWDAFRDSALRGTNVMQVHHFVLHGGAEAGFVSYSSLLTSTAPVPGDVWIVDENLYPPIVQQAVQLTGKPGAAAFLEYLGSPSALQTMENHGYDLPGR